MSFNGWMVTQTVGHQYHEIVLSNKREWIIATDSSIDQSIGNYADWQKPIPKGYMLYDFIYIFL